MLLLPILCSAMAEDPITWGFERYFEPLSIDTQTFVESENCADCHPVIYSQWSQSRHALAWSNDIFQAGYIVEPDPICVFCHAPLPEQSREVFANHQWYLAQHPDRQKSSTSLKDIPKLPEPRSAEGISCAVCHIRQAKVIGTQPADEAHPSIVSSKLSSSDFCKDCHDFPVVERHSGQVWISETPMQSTWQEWSTWAASQKTAPTCQDCHMPEGRHDFHGANHRPLLAKSLHVDVHRNQDSLTFTLRSVGVGHSFPTGDLFRHMTLEIREGKDWKVIHSMGRIFQLQFDEEDQMTHKRLQSDTSLKPGAPQKIQITAAHPIEWRVVYHYASTKDEERAMVSFDQLIEVMTTGISP